MKRYELKDTKKNHFKFWEISVYPITDSTFSIHRRWGRIGTNGSQKIDEKEYDLNKAKSIKRELETEKYAEGYRCVKDTGDFL
jgi:predicted DNA-binding WGR domain protein